MFLRAKVAMSQPITKSGFGEHSDVANVHDELPLPSCRRERVLEPVSAEALCAGFHKPPPRCPQGEPTENGSRRPAVVGGGGRAGRPAAGAARRHLRHPRLLGVAAAALTSCHGGVSIKRIYLHEA
jgi:hypothetical protein